MSVKTGEEKVGGSMLEGKYAGATKFIIKCNFTTTNARQGQSLRVASSLMASLTRVIEGAALSRRR